MLSHLDHFFLSMALSLARKGGNAVRPNPFVGAIIAKNTRVVADGYHARYSGPHAEAVALKRAGEYARGSTLYCNMEPCSFSASDKHNGPCTNKIINAGVERVVIGQLDPNPRIRGQGAAQLRKAGLEVELVRNEADRKKMWYANARFNTSHSLERPFVSLKLAQSLDGRIATAEGDSKWISDETARKEVHQLRASHDAVLVGTGTAVCDDPRLNVRYSENAGPTLERQPVAVVVDPYARLPIDSSLVNSRSEHLIVYVGDDESNETTLRVKALRDAGAIVCSVSFYNNSHLSLSHILDDLKQRGIQSVMIEGGARIATTVLRQSLFDALHVYIAPKFIGGDGKAIGRLGIKKVAEAIQLEEVKTRPLGSQVVLTGFRKGWFEEVSRIVEEAFNVHRTC